MNSNFFIKNRANLTSKLEENSILVSFAGQAVFKRGDEKYPFSPDRNFYYLTGIDKEQLILLITKKNNEVKETLFIERRNELLEKWVGKKINTDEAKEISGIKEIKFVDEFYSELATILFNNRYENVYADLENREWQTALSPAIQFANSVKEKYPATSIKDFYPIISELRTIKSEEEIELMRKAISITKEGVEAILKNTKPDMMEYELEAYFDYTLKKNGTERAFETIAASGENATTLHYVDNNNQAKDGDLILFDLGAEWKHYKADISRTFPANGKFTERQKLIYNIVLEGQLEVIKNIKPNVPFKSLNETLKKFYEKKLMEIGLIKSADEISNYYYHGVSHYLGAETHDVGRHNEGDLQAGMVLTVEPGLYIAEEKIGIRIEDDVLVTENGCEVLSKDIIKTVSEIEDFMRG